MRKYLLPPEGQYYKANLHCHTTVSDGRLTPQEVKDHYKSHGYSIVAFTDHCVLVPHPELADPDFLPLNGYETELQSRGQFPSPLRKHCHLCFIAINKDNVTMPYVPQAVWGNAKESLPNVQFNPDETFDAWYHDPDIINRVIRLGRKGGFFVTYNHPCWSAEHYDDYIHYTGMNAMEIANFGCLSNGYNDYNPHVYDEFIRKGERIFAVAADDNHKYTDTLGGWVMIKAEKLEYETITEALVKGNFYASRGPEIHDLWYEDGELHITCSAAKHVYCSFPDRRQRFVRADDAPLTEAVIPIYPEDKWFRVTVVDENNNTADTSAYYIEDLM